MAIINCPECGKEISDKANSCPHCGLPLIQNTPIQDRGNAITTDSEEIKQIQNPTIENCIGCPICGSTELHVEKQGFSGGKALVGAVLTGGIGLLAGTIGSKNVKITCLKCGNRFKAGEGQTVKKVTFPPSFIMDTSVVEKLKDGSRLAAVEEYKDIHNVELENAQAIIDTYIKLYPSVFKDQSPNDKDNNDGCATYIIALVIVSAVVYLLFSL